MSRNKHKKHRKLLRGLLIILILFAALCYSVYEPENINPPVIETASPSAEITSPFEVFFLDVGQGDCALVCCEGHAMLIDGGSAGQSQRIYSFLETHGINHLDYIVASHADADHVGGLAAALNYATTDTALCTVTSHDTRAFNSFVKYLDRQGVSITVPDAGDTFSLGSASFTVIAPKAGEVYSDNTSLIIRVEYGETSFLFTGDAEYPDEQFAMDSGSVLKSTVLKLAHHGSSSSSSDDFLAAVKPEYAVISVGADNSYGHPTERVLSRLQAKGVALLRTDLQGDIHCVSDGKALRFDVAKNPDIDTFSK